MSTHTAPADGTDVVVSTHAGQVRGVWHGGSARFSGIPFAAPPVGDLRFRPPAPVEPWSDVRPATEFGPISPQNASLIDALFGGDAEQWDEDCLYLNVWSTDPTPTSPRPVMVWIHGGAFEMGSGSSPLYNGESFARSGVVFVSLNYRLGAFGFLELGSVDGAYQGSGNVGLLDQVAALEWVRDNIAEFGGDPGRVTIFGESAGAMSVSLLLSMPAARGLFHRAVAQSGAIEAARTLDRAKGDTEEFMETMGAADVADLVAAPPQQLLAAHATMAIERMSDTEAVIARTGSPLGFLAFRPVRDGQVVPEDPLTAIEDGAATGVPLLIGTNAEEWKLFALMSPPPQTDEDLWRRLELVTDDLEGALAAYRDQMPEAVPADIEGAALTDVMFRMPAVRLADAQVRHAAVWQYLFSWRSPAWGGQIGASHAVEIPFVFDAIADQRLHVFVGPDAPSELARVIHESWVAFASGEAPGAEGLADWPALGGVGRPVMVFDEDSEVVDDPQSTSRRYWLSAPSSPVS
jgi:para-nitrobenzyl esterase